MQTAAPTVVRPTRRRTLRLASLLLAVAGLGVPAGLVAGLGLAGPAPAGASTTTATTLYVATKAHGGSNTANTACAQATPCATIAYALSLATPGDVVSVGPGTFIGGVNVDKSVTLEGAGADRTTVVPATGATPVAGITVDPGVDATVRNLTVTGNSGNYTGTLTTPAPTAKGQGGGISASTGSLTLVGDVVRNVLPFVSPPVFVVPGGIPNSDGAAGQDVVTTTTTNGFAKVAVGDVLTDPRQPSLSFEVAAVTSPTSITLSAPLPLTLRDDTLVPRGVHANNSVTIVDSTIGTTANDPIPTANDVTVESFSTNAADSTLELANSTLTGSRGLYLGTVDSSGLVAGDTAVTAVDDTVTNGAYLAGTSPLTIGNTILGTSCATHSTITDEGHNVIGATNLGNCKFVNGTNGDQVGPTLDLGVGPLALNGGTVLTAALLPGSAAIGTGSATLCAATPVNGLDERGQPRNQGSRGVCDVGAYDTGGKAASTTAVTWVTKKPEVGKPVSVKVTVESAAGAAGPAPTGKVTVSDDSTSCEARLKAVAGTAGTAAGSCALTVSAPGIYALTASYSGSSEYQPSATAAPTSVTVTAPTTTSLSLSKTEVTHGHETAETFSVAVTTGATGATGVPVGTARVKVSGKTLCTVTLATGAGTCAPMPDALAVGTATVTATYTGSADFDASTSAPATVTVAKG